MRISIAVLSAVLVLGVAPREAAAQAATIEDCHKEPTSQAIYQCLKQVFETSELELKHNAENLALILKRIDGTYAPNIDAVRSLKRAHDNWKEYRDKECGFLGSVMMWGGSGTPQAIAECLIKATDERAGQYAKLTDELKKSYLK